MVEGDDTILINRLLMYGCSLAPKFTTVTESYQLKLFIKKDNNRSGAFIVEGNKLMLASGGVCFLGDINKFNKSTKKTIATSMEALQNLNKWRQRCKLRN